MPDVVESDAAVSLRASAYQTYLNASNNTLRLFVNNVTPDPSFTAGSFTEASYPGYAFGFSAGNWSSPAQVVPGQWVIILNPLSFNAPSSGGAVTIYGGYLEDPSGTLTMSFLFTSPVVLNVGDPPLVVQVSYTFWARILLP